MPATTVPACTQCDQNNANLLLNSKDLGRDSQFRCFGPDLSQSQPGPQGKFVARTVQTVGFVHSHAPVTHPSLDLSQLGCGSSDGIFRGHRSPTQSQRPSLLHLAHGNYLTVSRWGQIASQNGLFDQGCEQNRKILPGPPFQESHCLIRSQEVDRGL